MECVVERILNRKLVFCIWNKYLFLCLSRNLSFFQFTWINIILEARHFAVVLVGKSWKVLTQGVTSCELSKECAWQEIPCFLFLTNTVINHQFKMPCLASHLKINLCAYSYSYGCLPLCHLPSIRDGFNGSWPAWISGFSWPSFQEKNTPFTLGTLWLIPWDFSV